MVPPLPVIPAEPPALTVDATVEEATVTVVVSSSPQANHTTIKPINRVVRVIEGPNLNSTA